MKKIKLTKKRANELSTFHVKQREISQRIVDVINKWSKALPWIETAHINDSNRACWFAGAFLGPYGWSYTFAICEDRQLVINAAVGYCKQYDICAGKIAKEFFGQLWDACHNLEDEFYIDSYDSEEAVPCT